LAKVKQGKPNREEMRVGLEIHRTDAQVRKVQAMAPWVGSVLIAFFMWLSIHDLAGHITIADISILAKAVTGKEGMSLSPAWYVVAASVLFGVVGINLARKERKGRKDAIERLHPYQEMWESLQSPSRTSSKLTPRGDTRPEDR